jgi:predicted ribonuclease YlaK
MWKTGIRAGSDIRYHTDSARMPKVHSCKEARMTDARPKLFVLDTNVILHDSGCIRNFEENDVAIPITVLEELDQFKRGNEDIHFQAREFLRRIDALTGDVLSAAGSPLGDGLGSIRVVLGGAAKDRLHESFLQDTPTPVRHEV